MITMQQLEELEARVIKALQLIGDLRAENGKLESDNEKLKAVAEEAKLSLEEKEQEIARIQQELEAATRELAGIKEKEELLEKKVIELLGKLDGLKVGPTPISGGAAPRVERKAEPRAERPSTAATGAVKRPVPPKPVDEEVSVESIGDEAPAAEKDEDIIIIDDETDLGGSDVMVETVSDKGGEEDEIILLDEGEDEIIIEDVESDMTIIDESEMETPRKKKAARKDAEDEDDFLIIEEDTK
jgi:DNA repair exonuclease SbcCD ATPase subunit